MVFEKFEKRNRLISLKGHMKRDVGICELHSDVTSIELEAVRLYCPTTVQVMMQNYTHWKFQELSVCEYAFISSSQP